MPLNTRFVVVSHPDARPRSFAGMLDRHPQIRAHGRLFDRADYEAMYEMESDGSLIKLGVDPVEFLESRIFLGTGKEVRAVGFCLAYDEAQTGSWSRLWSYARKNLHVIHLKQRNRLGAFLATRREGLDEVYVDPFEFQRYAESAARMEADFDTIFRYSPHHKVYWEDLVNNLGAEGQGVQQFLGVDNHHFDAPQKRVYTGPFVGACQNYHELKEHFNGTELSEYFP